jgi:respiratory burst oxidase
MKESKEFAGELFDALARKRGDAAGAAAAAISGITLEELRDYWAELTDQSFDNRLQLFFGMYYSNT